MLINSGVGGLLTEMAQIKARIAANSRAIGKICNADMGHFRRKAACHELISTSLTIFFILVLLPGLTASAGEYYIGPRAGADLLQAPRSNADVVRHLPRLTDITVLKKRRSWWKAEVSTDHGSPVTGWISAGAIRKQYQPKRTVSALASNISSFFSMFRRPPTGQQTAVLGVRGLEDEAKLGKANKASMNVVKWMEGLRVGNAEVSRFVHEGDLNP